MKTVTLATLFALFAMIVTGCAAPLQSSAALDTNERLARLERENAALRQQVTSFRAPPPVQAPVGVPTSVMGPPPAYLPPAGPPQDWFWMYTPPAGCESGSLSIQIINHTNYYLELMMDGKPLKIRGADGQLPMLPPSQKIFGCLDRLGPHHFSGNAYDRRYTQLVKVDSYTETKVFSASADGNPQFYFINERTLYFN